MHNVEDSVAQRSGKQGLRHVHGLQATNHEPRLVDTERPVRHRCLQTQTRCPAARRDKREGENTAENVASGQHVLKYGRENKQRTSVRTNSIVSNKTRTVDFQYWP